MIFFFDRNVGEKIPQALRILGLSVRWHDDHFARTTRDEEWLTAVGKNEWIVITHDARIAENQSERRAVEDAGVRCFVLLGSQEPLWGKVRWFAAGWDRMCKAIADEAPPYILKQRPSGWEKLL